MNIVVCIKQVPDAPNIRIDKQRMTIIREGSESIINPLDCVALEAALDLRRKTGGFITVMTMGPAQSEEALREALAAGADQAILITHPLFAGADTLATSRVVARAIAKLSPAPDLVLCGQQTIDSDTGHVGPQIAEELDLPQVCGVNDIRLDGDSMIVKRLSDGFLDTLRVKMPALLTVSRELCVPRHIPLGELERAFSGRAIMHWGLDDLDLKPEEVGWNGSATWVTKLQTPPPKTTGEVMSGSVQFMVENLLKKLEAMSIIDEDEGNG
jgi:electron transfer flavoprotein beta subunit